MNASFEKMLSVNSSIEIPLDGPVRVLTVIVSSIKPVTVNGVDDDGVVIPLGELIGNPVRRARFRDIDVSSIQFTSSKPFGLQYDIQLSGHEPNSGIPAVEHTTPQKLTRREEIERAVMLALAKTRTMPTEQELAEIETELGFRFDDDGMDWGHGFMEELVDQSQSQAQIDDASAITEAAPEAATEGETPTQGGEGA